MAGGASTAALDPGSWDPGSCQSAASWQWALPNVSYVLGMACENGFHLMFPCHRSSRRSSAIASSLALYNTPCYKKSGRRTGRALIGAERRAARSRPWWCAIGWLKVNNSLHEATEAHHAQSFNRGPFNGGVLDIDTGGPCDMRRPESMLPLICRDLGLTELERHSKGLPVHSRWLDSFATCTHKAL